MSTLRPSTRSASTKTEAKRRAAARRRNRTLIRQLGALFFVAIFVIGTASVVFVSQVAAPASTAATPVVPAVTQAAAQGATEVPTAGANALQQLAEQGDQAAAKQDWDAASSFYLSALGQSDSNATLHYKLGKVLIEKGDYPKAVEHLQKSVSLNPSSQFAAEAQSLVGQYKDKPATTAAPAPGGGAAVRGTGTPQEGVGGTGTITATGPITR